ncbi:MAG TPA: hypothetical protein ENI22_02365 [Candidatus Pacearchaeota archaeon]|nr:hypothetical protein [Candidatus Pacearchaeota archaeon]
MKVQKIILLMIFILILIVIIFYIPSLNETQINEISSFEECAAAGFPVMESYPRQCRDAEGNLFVEVVRRQYVGYSVEECLTISILCTPDREYFSDETGCGCELKKEVLEERVNCTDESRNADACIEIYQPVCGWFDSGKVVCVKYPCAVTFSNSCFACMDKTILYYTEGECPE